MASTTVNVSSLPGAVEDLTRGVRNPVITEVILWIAPSTATAHWRTSYVFEPATSEGYIGMVVDIYQPLQHALQSPEELRLKTDNSFGTMTLTVSQDRIQSRGPAFTRTIRVQATIKVQDVLNLIYADKRQYYQFDVKKSSGCLYWQLSLLERFESIGWIPAHTTANIRNSIEVWRNASPINADMVPWPPVQGAFCLPPQTTV